MLQIILKIEINEGWNKRLFEVKKINIH